MERFCYHYDGTYAGFLTCVRDIYQYQEFPALFLPLDDPSTSLYPHRHVTTDVPLAKKVRRRLRQRLGPRGLRLVEMGFLTCMEDRECRLLELIDFGFQTGPGVERRLDAPAVVWVWKGVRHLQRECDLLRGFVRFSDYEGLLVGEISPKNQVLPLLRPHFCDRLAEEEFLLYDRTHHQVLLHKPGQWAILPAEDLTVPAPGASELACRALWRQFYHTLAIQSRYNPQCRRSHMPQRYWENMTEFQDDPGPGLLPA